ncbi:uncharacterized protein LOC129808451 [Phlebotomus papatasi]|uniref:uncharacterized protein LOC129808451 n=1 Tax=Phlebotomus papatasi TaxID=29031 RepID=UPI002483CA1B|nr:uncharacterized protein LOC129808451 [Phlebotomus papatasi]
MQDLLLEQEKRHTAEINKLFEKIATLSAPQKDITSDEDINVTHSEISTNQSPNIFLATAIVDVLDEQGRRIQCRALLDSGAQINLMSANFMRKLNLPKCPTNISVLGIGAHSSQASHSTEATIFSRNSNEHYNLQCIVVPKITGNLPNCPVDNKSLVIPPGIQLADPTWYLQKPIDLLIGGESYWDIILDGTIELGEGKPKLKPTTFGHIIVGKLQQVSAYCNLTVLESLNQTLSRFWEIEGLPEDTQINDEHRDAEEHFMATHSRTPEGRFVVELQFKRDINGQIPRLGDSRHTAVRQLHNLERRFHKNPTLKRLYVDVMHDYLDKGWMERVPESEVKNYAYYMPHHGVLKGV